MDAWTYYQHNVYLMSSIACEPPTEYARFLEHLLVSTAAKAKFFQNKPLWARLGRS